MNQDDKFLESEGNNWFSRNQDYLNNKASEEDVILRIIKEYNLTPKKVFEVGCSNGWRLNEINKLYGSDCFGVEPSEKAILDGQKKYPNINFYQSTASNIPIEIKNDLVIINYVLHWVSRNSLLKSIAEIDRIVDNDGYLLIGDFFPDNPTIKGYHHLSDGEVFTYKIDYAAIFLATGMYTLVAKNTFDHETHNFQGKVAGDNRGVCVLLRKSDKEFFISI